MPCVASMAAEGGLTVERLGVALDGGYSRVLRDLSFEIAPGEAFGLVGESGSGKSMTCRAILGLLPRGAEVTGRIAFAGRALLELSEPQMRRLRGSKIAMIFQDPMSALNPVLRVGSAIAQVIRSHERLDAGAARRRAVELMGRVGIQDAERRARAYPHEFSGGMRQRIVIAMALAARPSLLLADEPTTALDVIVQAGILRLLDRLRREDGMSLLLVSHDLGVVAGVCDRVAVMYAGELVEEGPTARVLFEPHMPYTIGLLDSVPRRAAGARLRSIPGAPPQPLELPPGCAFAPRCGLAAEICRAGPVPPVAIVPGHWARCRRLDQLAALRPKPQAAPVRRHA
jgi:glutathione transport system ATP-binding protein